MKEWFIAGWLHLIIGFVIGWIVFKQPAWADTAWQWFKHTVLRRP